MASKKKGKSKSSPRRRRQATAKADQVETRTPSESAELPLPKPDKLTYHYDSVKGWKEKLTTIQGKLRNAYKAAKADNVSKATLDFLASVERDDPNDLRAEMEARSLALREAGAPFQITVFDAIYDSPVDQAKAEAKIAAKAGRTAEPRWAEGTPEHAAYLEEYGRVQAGMVAGADKLTPKQIEEARKSEDLRKAA